MTHQMDEGEYQEYLEIKKQHEEYKRIFERQMDEARRMLTPYDKLGDTENVPRYSIIDNLFNGYKSDLICHYKPNHNYYCDHCLPTWILHECPFGHDKQFSK